MNEETMIQVQVTSNSWSSTGELCQNVQTTPFSEGFTLKYFKEIDGDDVLECVQMLIDDSGKLLLSR